MSIDCAKIIKCNEKKKGSWKKKARQARAKMRAKEQARQRRWEEAWEKKLKMKEELDDIPCCTDTGLCLKPKTMSNIWINVAVDKNKQDIQMAFKHVPIPKPKPPPLPPLKRKLSNLIMDNRTAPYKKTGGLLLKPEKSKDDEKKKYIPYRERFKCPYN